ncbi:restriction endonuclease subunit S [Empedobacter falsenii]|uniref:restriction endonuclease subunit S n=1 Tax=Empedobacter falsenii TaxID=343874 RepID=UPI0025786232|nr:restriction endonuclease subunit S [Empedobacter falsenii]
MEGYKQMVLGLIPEGWKVSKLGNVFEIIGGGTPDTTISEYWDGDILWFTPTEIKSKFVSNSLRKITNKGVNNSSAKLLPKGSLLFTSRATIADIALCEEECTTNQGFQSFLPNENQNMEFLYYWIISNKHQFLRRSSGSTFLEISKKEVGKVNYPLPPIEEQKAIADCLSTWDKAIEKQEQLIKSKESRHKALMQKLLSGKQRLPGFSEDWKEVKLEDFGSSYNGLSGKNKDDFGSGKPFITYMNVFSNSVIDTSIFELVNVADNENQNSVKYGDILFTVSSETASEAGMVSVYLDNSPVDIYLNSFCFGVRLNTLEILNPRFASFLLRFDDFRKEVFKLSQGSTRYNISKSGVLGIKFHIPNIDEQLKITEILEGSEKEIELEKRKVNQLKEQKKALMQKLLTGRVRLPLNN